MHFEGLSGAANVSVVAFSIVFGVLFVLTGVIYCMKIFAGSGGEKKNDVVVAKPSTPSTPSAAAEKATPNVDKAKIVAAITAAIVEFTGNSDFQILSIQPDSGVGVYPSAMPVDYWTSRWKMAGMLAQNANRLNRRWH